MMQTVLVTGGTGAVGRYVAAGLARAGWEPVVATRRPEAGQRGDAPEVLFDYDAPGTFAAALAGIGSVFLVVRPGDDQADQTAVPFLMQAERAGVRRVVLISAMGVERLDGAALRIIERWLEASRLAWTFLRPNFFMQVFGRPPLSDTIRDTSELSVPAADAALSFIDARDIAEVAVRVLVERGHDGRAYTLTGPEALRHDEVASLIGEAVGRPVSYRAASDDEAAAAMRSAGLGEARVARLLGFYAAVRAGWCTPVTSAVADILGAGARSFRAYAREQASTWRGAEPAPRK